MSDYRQRREGDLAQAIDLDIAFTALDMRRDATLGTAQATLAFGSVNCRFDGGDWKTRPGCLMPSHFNNAPWESILGAGIFSDPDGNEWMLVASPTDVWMLADGWTPVPVALPGALDGPVEFVQTFDSVCMLRGDGKPTWVWGGDRFQPFKEASAGAPSPDSPAFLSPTPAAEFGVVMADRLFLPTGRDTISWSDVLDFQRFDLALNNARFNRGEDDKIVAISPYQGNRLVVLKSQSIAVMSNVDDIENRTVDFLKTRIGCRARNSVVEIGNDVLFLGDDGVYSVTQTDLDTLRAVAVPRSEPVNKIFDRVNWDVAHKACGVTVGQLYHLALPLDNSRENNAVVVYDVADNAWQSIDYYGAAPPRSPDQSFRSDFVAGGHGPSGEVLEVNPPIAAPQAQTMLATDLFGRRTAFLLDGRRVIALGHGDADWIDGVQRPITSRMTTRGYHLDDLRAKQLQAIAPNLAERGAKVSIAVITDGVNERLQVVTDRERDRTKYTIHGRADYDLGNAGDDHGDPHREDYDWLAGDGALMMENGIVLGQLQEWDRGYHVRMRGRWFKVEIEATGRVALKGLIAHGTRSRGQKHEQQ